MAKINREYLLLSADWDISLYEVDTRILTDFQDLLDEFYKWKRTNCYDETLFVTFLKKRLGDNSIKYVKKVGRVGSRVNIRTGKVEDDIAEEYKSTKWYNF